MFERFTEYKTRYERGQVFPFLIAIIVVMIILAMITANLGQIGLFRTEVSNAADSGALSAVSVLSGTLLGFGLASDTRGGDALVRAVGIVINCYTTKFPKDIYKNLSIWYVGMSEALAAWLQTYETGTMAWSNAKTTAFEYAFQNAGINEPPPLFETFLYLAYGYSPEEIRRLSPTQLRDYYNRYAYDIFPQGHDPDARRRERNLAQTGFARFTDKKDWWNWQRYPIEPRRAPPYDQPLEAGYGWTVNNDGSVTHRYNGGPLDYKNYDNWVEVQVYGSITYPVVPLTFVEAWPVGVGIAAVLIPIGLIPKYIIYFTEKCLKTTPPPADLFCPEIGALIGTLVGIAVSLLFIGFISSLIAGLKMDNIDQQTEGNPILVLVTRHKRDAPLGFWHFRYDDITSEASAHVFREIKSGADYVTIEPVIYRQSMEDFLNELWQVWDWDMFNTNRHLFETKLVHTQ
jgi:hypothetical protein